MKFNPKTAKERQFEQGIQTYFDRLHERKVAHQVWCCSDIIESAFGKFKYKMNPNHGQKMTKFIFTLANFGTQCSKQEVLDALQKVKLKDIQSSKNKK